MALDVRELSLCIVPAMIRGTVLFAGPGDRVRVLSAAMAVAVRDVGEDVYLVPTTLAFVPASWGLPDRWFIHWAPLQG